VKTEKIERGKTFQHHYVRFRIEGLTRENPPRVQVIQLTDAGMPAGTMWRFTKKSVHLLLVGKNPGFRSFGDLPEIVNKTTTIMQEHCATSGLGESDSEKASNDED
jgi:hypothetical protein